MRLPLVPTIMVGLAVAAMIGLGIWQWGRAEQKDALRARYEQNRTLPPMALPAAPDLDGILYRRASAFCLEVVGWRRLGGVAASGKPGTRHVANCRTGAEGPGFAADIGVSADPRARPQWRGGEVSGIVIREPRQGGIFDRWRGETAAARPMLVSLTPASGLEASKPPSPPQANSSRSYAFQWFFFAAIALVIYLVALRRRQLRPIDQPSPRG